MADEIRIKGECKCGHWQKIGPHDPTVCPYCKFEGITLLGKRGRKPSPPAKETDVKRLRRENAKLRRDLDRITLDFKDFKKEVEQRLRNLELDSETILGNEDEFS